jgi:hypothetical protein
MKKILLVVVLLQNILFINAQNKTRSYDDQISFIFNLSSKFVANEIGNIDYPDHSYTMYKITYNHSGETNNKRFLFVCGVHGDEVAPVFAMKNFILDLDSREEPVEGITIDFIYILNPYGFEHDTRYNGYGKDLNRDFVKKENPEVKIFVNSTKDIPYSGVYDFHEAPVGSGATGFFLFYYAGRNKRPAGDIASMIKENTTVSLENKYTEVTLKAKGGIVHMPSFAKWVYRSVLKKATVTLYFDKLNVDKVFLFETPMIEAIEQRERIDELLFNYIIK